MSDSIKLHDMSVEYLKSVFKGYHERVVDSSSFSSYTIDEPIIHLYADSDTYAEDGQLNGYVDSLFFNAHVYDPIRMVVYDRGKFDGLETWAADVNYVRIFKDGSTMISLKGKHIFNETAVLSAYKKDEQERG